MDFRLINQSVNQMTWIDPTNLTNTVSASWSSTQKPRLDAPQGRAVRNSRWTFKSNSVLELPVPAGCSACDAGSENTAITTTVSASVSNSQEMAKRLLVHIQNLQTLASDLLNGIPPRQDVKLTTSSEG